MSEDPALYHARFVPNEELYGTKTPQYPPKEIWLNISEDGEMPPLDEIDWGEVTWSPDKATTSALRYVEAPEAEWTTEPPTRYHEHYWWRRAGTTLPRTFLVIRTRSGRLAVKIKRGLIQYIDEMGGEWWPVPIPQPPP